MARPVLTVTIVAALATPSAVAVDGVATDHVIVRLRPGVAPAQAADGRLTLRSVAQPAGQPDAVADTLAAWQATAVRPVFESGFANPAAAARLGLDRLYRIETPDGTDTPAMAGRLAELPDVIDRVELDPIGGVAGGGGGEGGGPPDDPDFGLQWGLQNIGQAVAGVSGVAGADVSAVPAWTAATGDPNLILAVLDAGMDPHVELLSRLIAGKNVAASPDDDDTSDVCISHGTHVAGIAAADANNLEGIAGVDWSCKIMPVRVLNTCTGPESYLAEGLVWAADHDADVINMSLQYYSGSQTLHDAVTYAYEAGVVLIAAAGNQQGCPSPPATAVSFPARWPETIAVAATTNVDERASISNCGPEIDAAAPGQTIWSLKDTTDYQYMTGTSMATPHVSGAATLLLSLDPSLTAEQIRQLLADNADDIEDPGPDSKTGAGRINLAATVDDLLSPPCPWDLDTNGVVDTLDFLDLLAQWGTDPGGPPDFDGNGTVDTVDFLELLSHWGVCP